MVRVASIAESRALPASTTINALDASKKEVTIALCVYVYVYVYVTSERIVTQPQTLAPSLDGAALRTAHHSRHFGGCHARAARAAGPFAASEFETLLC